MMSLKWPLRPLKSGESNAYFASFLPWILSQKHEADQTRINCKRNFYFFIDLATTVMVAKNKVTAKEEPYIFDNAWNCPDEELWRKWREAMEKEFSNMIKQQVWSKISKSCAPNCRHIKSKWFFKLSTMECIALDW